MLQSRKIRVVRFKASMHDIQLKLQSNFWKGMIVLTLEETIQLILDNQSEFDRKSILKMIQEKREELGPEIVNDESAAMIIARELGIDLQVSTKARFRIEDIDEDTKAVAMIVKVISPGEVRTFSRQDGTEGKVASLTVADETGRIRLVLWDDKTQAVTDGALEVDTVIQIRGGYVKKGLGDALEVNLGRSGYINPLDDYDMEDLEIDLTDAEIVKIDSLKDRMFSITVKVKVGNVYPLSTFTRKSDGSEGKVLSIQASDDTGSTRLVFWDDKAELMQDVKVGEVISVSGANSREGRYGDIEIHVGKSAIIQREIEEEIDAVPIAASSAPTAEPIGKKTISELTADMRDVDIEGKIVSVFDVRTFERDGKEGKVQNIMIADDTGRIRVTFWNEDVDKVKGLDEGDIVRIKHGYCKAGYRGGVEYQVGFKAEIETNPDDSELESLDIAELAKMPTRQYGRVMISDITAESENDSVEVSGIVVRVPQSNPIYLACPKCRKKVQDDDGKQLCSTCGEVKKPEARMLYKVTLDDGSGTIRVTLFGEAGEKLLQMTGAEAQKLIEKEGETAPFDQNSEKMLGRYVVVNGKVTKYRDSIDISAAGLDFVDPEKEILRMKGQIEELTS